MVSRPRGGSVGASAAVLFALLLRGLSLPETAASSDETTGPGPAVGGDSAARGKQNLISELLATVHANRQWEVMAEPSSDDVVEDRIAEIESILGTIDDQDIKIQHLMEVVEEQREEMARLSGRATRQSPSRAPSGTDLSAAPMRDSRGFCTWEALSRTSAGLWRPTTRRANFDTTCPYMKDRYKCEWDRGWEHVMEWVPEPVADQRCKQMGLSFYELAARAQRRVNVLIIGNSLLRELYETIACHAAHDMASYKNLRRKDDFSITSTRWMEVIYVFRDYGAEGLGNFIRDHEFGADLQYNETNQDIDIFITNYHRDLIDTVYNDLFEGQAAPPVIYTSHACARGAHDPVAAMIDVPREMDFVSDHRNAGLPVFDLCTMSKEAIEMEYDVQARKMGRVGDPHLCMPGPHYDMMGWLFQMMADLLAPRWEDDGDY